MLIRQVTHEVKFPNTELWTRWPLTEHLLTHSHSLELTPINSLKQTQLTDWPMNQPYCARP